jgi:hypothetical protein
MAHFLSDIHAAPVLSQRLLLSIAEELKLPFLQIARQAELGVLHPHELDISVIQATADSALKLLDSYVLAVQLATDEEALFMSEPVSISSVLYDVGQQLTPIAKAYDVTLQLHVSGKYGPVMANRRGLQAALLSLGYALIEALPAIESPQLTLQLSAHRCRYGIVTGLYSETETLTADTLRLGRELYGRARQPLTSLSHSASAGIFVADALFRAMSSELMTTRHQRLHGLGAILQPNPQMQLI